MNDDSHAPVSASADFKRAVDETANHCFGCGPANPQSLKLVFAIDAEAVTATAKVKLTRMHEGPPGHIHGGIVATLMDEAMGKLSRPLDVIAMTRNMEVDYLRPSPLGVELTLRATHVRREGRKIWNEAELVHPDGTVLVRAKGLFLGVDQAMLERIAKGGAEQVGER